MQNVQEGDGARVCVEALYDVRSSRRIGLTFQAAGVSEIVISPLLETLLAPALLPRTFLNQQILLFLKEVGPAETCLRTPAVFKCVPLVPFKLCVCIWLVMSHIQCVGSRQIHLSAIDTCIWDRPVRMHTAYPSICPPLTCALTFLDAQQ